jgi:hypothetical protein
MLIPNDRPKSQILMIVAWASDLVWLPLIAFGSTPIREIGFAGFAISLILGWIMLSIYNRGKVAGRYTKLSARPWKDQIW